MTALLLARTKRSRAVAVALAVGSMAALSGEQWRRIFRARERGNPSPPTLGHAPPRSRRRVLVVGDSTGAGVGSQSFAESVAGRLVKDFPQAEVQNAAVRGATVADVVRHVRNLTPSHPFDLVLVFAGGNDVIRRTPWGFFHERDADPFSAEPDWYYADDGVHPSAEAYAYCYERMKPLISRALDLPPEAGCFRVPSIGARHERDAAQRRQARACPDGLM